MEMHLAWDRIMNATKFGDWFQNTLEVHSNMPHDIWKVKYRSGYGPYSGYVERIEFIKPNQSSWSLAFVSLC